MSTANPQEISSMNLGPKMGFIVRVYQMTEAENELDLERDRAMLKSGAISDRDFRNRSCTRDVARYYRARDDAAGPPWPRQWSGRHRLQEARNRQDYAQVLSKDAIRAEVVAVLREMGMPAPPSRKRQRPQLHIVKSNDDDQGTQDPENPG